MTQFIPLPSLRSAVEATRKDLTHARAVNATLQQKVAAVSDKKQYSQAYIEEQRARLRDAAAQDISTYLVSQKTYPRLSQIAAQKDFWTVQSYLFRAPGTPDATLEAYNDAANAVKLLKTVLSEHRLSNLLFSLSRMNESTIEEIASAALDLQDWSKLGACYTELSGRTGDNAVSLRLRLQSIEIPDMAAAKELIAEAAYLEELLGYTLRAIGNGQEDIGIRFESYQTISNDQQKAREQAALQSELDREAAVVQVQLGQLVRTAP